MKRITERIKYWGQLLLLPIYWLSFLFPRDKHIWLFGSTFGRRFAGYPRNDILFEECGLQSLYQKEEQILMQHIEEWKAGFADSRLFLGIQRLYAA